MDGYTPYFACLAEGRDNKVYEDRYTPCFACLAEGRDNKVYEVGSLDDHGCSYCEAEDIRARKSDPMNSHLCQNHDVCIRDAMDDGGCWEHPSPCIRCGLPNHWTGNTCHNCSSKTLRKIYYLEGNISSGKSTLGQRLEDAGYVVYQEPVNEWINEYVDSQTGENILGLFYKDKPRYAFQFEVLVMITRWKKIKHAINSGHSVVIIERSLDTDANIFVRALKEEGSKSNLDWKIYSEWYETFKSEIDHHFTWLDIKTIYLRTEPDECHSRISSRARDEESSIPLEYLTRIHNLHEEWIGGKDDTIMINGHQSKEQVLQDIIDVIEK